MTASAAALLGVVGLVYAVAGSSDARPTAHMLTPGPVPSSPDVPPNEPFAGLQAAPPPSASASVSASASPSAKPSPGTSRSGKPPLVPSTSASQWVYGTVARPTVGTTGTVLRYRVAVERVGGQDPNAFGERVHQTLGGAQGWTHQPPAGSSLKAYRFQQVTSGTADFTIWLATPETTDALCGKYGIHTEGEVSCRGGKDVVINLKRWTQGSPSYAPGPYRDLVVNHEVGHFLGHSHVSCPGDGKPAPVMQTQYYGMNGCVPNTWPYTNDDTYLD